MKILHISLAIFSLLFTQFAMAGPWPVKQFQVFEGEPWKSKDDGLAQLAHLIHVVHEDHAGENQPLVGLHLNNRKISFRDFLVGASAQDGFLRVGNNRRNIMLHIIFSSSSVWAQDKPNVIIMLVDNLGWGELGVYGGGELRGAPTPNLDKFAAEGIWLQNFNVEPQCTPSRSALMTGRHPIRSGTTKVVWGILYGMTRWGKTIPELMSDGVIQQPCLANGSWVFPVMFKKKSFSCSGNIRHLTGLESFSTSGVPRQCAQSLNP